MTDNAAREERKMRLDAYYYGFTPTGVESIDRILSAVACAGKAYHHTESWGEETPPYEPFLRGRSPADWIQNAASDAASAYSQAFAAAIERAARVCEKEDTGSDEWSAGARQCAEKIRAIPQEPTNAET